MKKGIGMSLVVVAGLAVGGCLGYVLFPIHASLLYGDPRLFMVVGSPLALRFNAIKFAVGMVGSAGAVCGAIAGCGFWLGNSIHGGFGKAISTRLLTAVPMAALGLILGTVGGALVGGIVALVFGVVLSLFLYDFIPILVQLLYPCIYGVAVALCVAGLVGLLVEKRDTGQPSDAGDADKPRA